MCSAMICVSTSLSAKGSDKYNMKASDRQSPCSLISSAGIPHWNANVAPPRQRLWPEKSFGSKEIRDAKCLMPSLRDFAVMQVSWFEVEVKVKKGQTSGAGTILSNNLRAVVGQSVDSGMKGTGTTRAVSPACRVLVLVTVRQAPEWQWDRRRSRWSGRCLLIRRVVERNCWSPE